MIENVSTQLTVFHCFAHCLLPGRAFASLYALLFLEKEAEIGGRAYLDRKIRLIKYQHNPFGRNPQTNQGLHWLSFINCNSHITSRLIVVIMLNSAEHEISIVHKNDGKLKRFVLL